MPKRLKDIIKKARKSKGYSQAQLGKLVKSWGTYIGQIEKGDRTPSDEKCKDLAKVLDLDLKGLLLLAMRERADIPEAKKLLDVSHMLITDAVILELMGDNYPKGQISNYNLVKEIFALSTYEKKVVSSLVMKFAKSRKKKDGG